MKNDCVNRIPSRKTHLHRIDIEILEPSSEDQQVRESCLDFSLFSVREERNERVFPPALLPLITSRWRQTAKDSLRTRFPIRNEGIYRSMSRRQFSSSLSNTCPRMLCSMTGFILCSCWSNEIIRCLYCWIFFSCRTIWTLLVES